MGSERKSKRHPSIAKESPRKKLGNITNLDTNLELRNLLAEKDSTIQAQAALIEKLELILEQKSAQNEEIISHYYRQYKELEQARQELKILQHDYTQMSSVYRIGKCELQAKLDDANEKISRLMEERGNEECLKKPFSKRTSRRVTSSASTKVLGDASSRLNIPSIPEASPIPTTVNQRPVSTSGRPVRKAVETVTSYKEPPLNTKMRRG